MKLKEFVNRCLNDNLPIFIEEWDDPANGDDIHLVARVNNLEDVLSIEDPDTGEEIKERKIDAFSIGSDKNGNVFLEIILMKK